MAGLYIMMTQQNDKCREAFEKWRESTDNADWLSNYSAFKAAYDMQQEVIDRAQRELNALIDAIPKETPIFPYTPMLFDFFASRSSRTGSPLDETDSIVIFKATGDMLAFEYCEDPLNYNEIIERGRELKRKINSQLNLMHKNRVYNDDRQRKT